ncbi:unnamed protein product [Cylindrotheca closterium]|uniref:Pentacotripeptide-repeat region of PRORP domain-containing protein n=1 Tax=Cylindrotheca closterium TaxID=2856 RepID=A0AAD2FV11_9STRA|nr:unnamed protein product [Cylindrotheca closterium]
MSLWKQNKILNKHKNSIGRIWRQQSVGELNASGSSSSSSVLPTHFLSAGKRRRRSFSSEVSQRQFQRDDILTSEYERWKDMTNEVHNFSFSKSASTKDAQMWHQAESCLQIWQKEKDFDRCLELLRCLSSSKLLIKTIPTESLLNPILKLWRSELFTRAENDKAKNVLLPSQMSSLLNQYEAIGLIVMDKASHSMILDAASHMKDPKEGVFFAQEYLTNWIEKCRKQTNGQSVRPDVVSIGSVIHAWVESNHPEAPKRAEEWMNVCTKFLNIQPTTQLYTSVISAWGKQGDARRAQDWMNRLRQRNLEVDLGAWNGLLSAYAHSNKQQTKRRGPSPAKQAEQILKEMKRRHDNGELAQAPDVVSHTIVLDAWSRQVLRERGAKAKAQCARRAIQLLDEMKQSPNPSTRPNTISYNTVLSTCARAGLVKECESLMNQMIHEHSQHSDTLVTKMTGVQPNAQSVALLLHAYSQARMDPMLAAEKAEATLKDLLPTLGIQPNLQIFNNCLSCWAKASNPKTIVPVERATALFEEISSVHGMKPDIVAYTALMNVLGRHGEAEQAQNLLDDLWKTYQDAVHSGDPSANSYKPSAQSLTTVLYAWSTKDPEQTEALLQRMSQDYDAVPNVYSYSVVLKAWARHASSDKYPDAPDRALAILEFMEDHDIVTPNVFSYSSVIQAFAEQGRAKEAEGLLNRMLKRLQKDPTDKAVKPDLYTFSAVLFAWSKSNAPHAANRAEAILVRMLELYFSGDLDQPPNVYCYTNVLACIAQSRQPGSSEWALGIMRSMQKNQSKNKGSHNAAAPNLFSYNTVINAFANEIGRMSGRGDDITIKKIESMMAEVFDLVQEMIDLGEQDRKMMPDETTYLTVCKAIQNVRTRSKHKKHVNRLLSIVDQQRYEPTTGMRKQFRELMR